MKTKKLGLVALLAAGVLTLTGCGNNETPGDENVWLANPASVYCGEQWGTLQIETAEDWSQSWICLFDDGSYCEEWSFKNGECQPGEIIYNTIPDDVIPETSAVSQLYSEEDLAAAEAVIINEVNNKWQVKVESFELAYDGDEISTDNLPYCQSLNPEITECAIFTSSFHIPEQDVEMAGAFEPNTDLDGFSWTLGRSTAWEWEILTNGFG